MNANRILHWEGCNNVRDLGIDPERETLLAEQNSAAREVILSTLAAPDC